MLEAINVHKTYNHGTNKLHILKGIHLSVRQGDVLSIVGPSGAGKSTLLHILGVLDHPSDGQVVLDGEDVYRLNDRWNVGGYLRWETVTNLLQEGEVRATRDLHDWLLDFGFNVRKSSQTAVKGGTNKEFFAQLRLKALPVIDLHTGHRASFSQPRIGKQVSGSNEAPPPPSYSVSPDAQYVSLSAA